MIDRRQGRHVHQSLNLAPHPSWAEWLLMPSDPASPIEGLIEEVIERAVERLLGPDLRRICEPEPAVYTVAQAAVVLQVSEDTIARLVRRGVLHRVPHVGGKVLIPASGCR